jgi:hypothetical protein
VKSGMTVVPKEASTSSPASPAAEPTKEAGK